MSRVLEALVNDTVIFVWLSVHVRATVRIPGEDGVPIDAPGLVSEYGMGWPEELLTVADECGHQSGGGPDV